MGRAASIVFDVSVVTQIAQEALGALVDAFFFQLIHHCGESQLRTILGITDTANLETWMTREKTEAALRIASSSEAVTAPAYMLQAAKFIHG